MNQRLFVGGDTSLNGNLTVVGSLQVQKYNNQYIINTTTTNYNLIIGQDVSINNRLYVYGDVSLNSKLNISSDVSMNERLFVGRDVSLNGNLYIGNNTIIQGDVSMNRRLFLGGDVSLNGNLTLVGSLNVKNYTNQNIINTTTTNYSFIVGQDLSLNGRLFLGGDVSSNGNLHLNNYYKVNRITEYINTLTVGTTISIPFSTNASVNYILNPTANFIINFTGVPTDANQTFTSTIIINTGTSNRFYCNQVTIDGVSKTLLCNGGISNVSLGSCTYVTQSFAFINVGGSSPLAIFTNVTPYQ
jgi:predicted acyltransferase (DUF342 family)